MKLWMLLPALVFLELKYCNNKAKFVPRILLIITRLRP